MLLQDREWRTGLGTLKAGLSEASMGHDLKDRYIYDCSPGDFPAQRLLIDLLFFSEMKMATLGKQLALPLDPEEHFH